MAPANGYRNPAAASTGRSSDADRGQAASAIKQVTDDVELLEKTVRRKTLPEERHRLWR